MSARFGAYGLETNVSEPLPDEIDIDNMANDILAKIDVEQQCQKLYSNMFSDMETRLTLEEMAAKVDEEYLTLSLEGMIKKIWDAIVNAFKKVVEFIQKSIEWVKKNLMNNDGRQKAIEKLINGRSWKSVVFYTSMSDKVSNVALQVSNTKINRLSSKKDLKDIVKKEPFTGLVMPISILNDSGKGISKLTDNLDKFVTHVRQFANQPKITDEEATTFSEKSVKLLKEAMIKNNGQVDRVYDYFLPSVSNSTVAIDANGNLQSNVPINKDYMRDSSKNPTIFIESGFSSVTGPAVYFGLDRSVNKLTGLAGDLQDILKDIERKLAGNLEEIDSENKSKVKRLVNYANVLSSKLTTLVSNTIKGSATLIESAETKANEAVKDKTLNT